MSAVATLPHAFLRQLCATAAGASRLVWVARAAQLLSVYQLLAGGLAASWRVFLGAVPGEVAMVAMAA